MRLLPAMVVAALTIGTAPAAARAFELRRDSSGTPVRLKTEEIVFRLPARLPEGMVADEVQAAIASALEAWAGAAGVHARLVEGDPAAQLGYRAGAENHNDIVFVEADWPYDDGAAAVTLVALDPASHAIVDADLAINAAQHHFRCLPPGNTGGIYDDLQSTVTHEFGHAFGLAHSHLEEAVMYPAGQRGDTSKRTLSADDREGIAAIYSGAAEALAAFGCSSATGAPSTGMAVLLAGLALGARRVRARATFARE